MDGSPPGPVQSSMVPLWRCYLPSGLREKPIKFQCRTVAAGHADTPRLP